MNGIKISQIRWPVELYEWLTNKAYEKRQSINKTVIDLIEESRKRGAIQ